MKNIQRALLLIAVLTAATGVRAQVQNADTMINRLFATLKAKDEKAYVALYPNSQQLGRFMKKIMQTQRNVMTALQQTDSSQGKGQSPVNMDSLLRSVDSMMTAQLAEMTKPENYAAMEKKFAKSFAPVLQQGEAKGVNWAAATLTGYRLDSTVQTDSAAVKMLGADFKSLKGVLDFTSGGKAYQLSVDNVVYLPEEGGWFGGDFGEVIRKGENFTTDKAETKEADGLESADAPPPAKAKTKVKSKTGEIKTKTKTTTRKAGAKS